MASPLLGSNSNGTATLVDEWQLPTLDVSGDNVELVAAIAVRPARTIVPPVGWDEIRTDLVSGGLTRYGLYRKNEATENGPYQDTFECSGGTAAWTAMQLALRSLPIAQPDNDDATLEEFDCPDGEDSPPITVTLPSTPDEGNVVIAMGGSDGCGGPYTGDESWDWSSGWTPLAEVTIPVVAGFAFAYRAVDGSPEDEEATSTYNLDKRVMGYTAIFELAVEPTPASPGGVIEFDDVFVDVSADIGEWTITRGASPELTGGSQPGSAVIKLINRDNKYNPENAAGPYYGFLRDGPRVWIGINEDGTIAFNGAKDIYGLFAGRITDLSVLPGDGTDVPPFVELVCEDPLGWMGRQKVRLADSRTRSQADVRAEVLAALGITNVDLCPEPTTLPLSGADGLALNILEAVNGANGTRHFAKPADNPTDWFIYTSVRRTSGLDGTSDASVDAGSEHVTGTSGWRVSADGVINQQRVSVDDILFPAPREVWAADSLPLTVDTSLELFADFGDYVSDPVVDYSASGSPTVTLTPFGNSAKLTIAAAGTAVFDHLSIRGRLVQRGSVVSVVIDDVASQADSRGIRAGSDLTGDYLGILVSARGFAEHIVWRFADARYRPTMTVVNWFPEMFELDLFDRISFTSSQLGLTNRLFEIVGLTHHGEMAADDGAGNPTAVLHTTIYTLQESRVQEATSWFTWDVTEWDDADSPWAY